MPNYDGWREKVAVVREVSDEYLSEEEKNTLRDIFVPLATALAEKAPRSQLYHDLARCQTEGRCSVLKYDPEKDKFVFTRDGKQRDLDPDLFVEKGFVVCRRKDSGDVYIRWGESAKGVLAVQYTEKSMCDPEDEFLGTVHLHPAGAVFPSGGDMFYSVLAKYGCIAGKVYNPEEKKEYARVLCHVADDSYVYDPRQDGFDLSYLFVEYPELVSLKQKYEREVLDIIRHYQGYTLKVTDADGRVFVYVFPPRTPGVLHELVRKVKEVYRDTHRFELFTVDLSRSEPPDLSSIER